MGDPFMKTRVAAIQATPVFLDRDASVEKACSLIAEAGANGARLAVFPETWLPGYCVWFDWVPSSVIWDHPPAKRLFARLVANSVEVPGPAIDALSRAAAQAGCAVAIGVHERESSRSGTLYNSIVTIDADGQLLGVHRKLVPTYTERLIWGRGDASTLSVYDSTVGRLGGLVCWEHWMPLARHAMHVEGEQVHVAVWPSVGEMHQIASRHYAFEGRCFVLAVGATLQRKQIPSDLALFHDDGVDPETYMLNGGSAIIGPDGQYLAGPMGCEEGMLYADLDYSRIAEELMTLDTVGHYARPDLFQVTIDRTPQSHASGVGVVRADLQGNG